MGGTFSIRFESTEPGESWSAERSMTRDFVLRALPGLKVEEDGPVTIRGAGEWLPLKDRLEIAPGSALDSKPVVPWHASAGELGRVIVNPSDERSGEIPTHPGEDTLAIPLSVAANGQARMGHEIAVDPRETWKKDLQRGSPPSRCNA
jgi:hypothetical protein